MVCGFRPSSSIVSIVNNSKSFAVHDKTFNMYINEGLAMSSGCVFQENSSIVKCLLLSVFSNLLNKIVLPILR